MVNIRTKHTQPVRLALVHDSASQSAYAPKSVDLFLEERARVLVTTLDLNQTAAMTCHIHASKKIIILDGYAEVELPDTCLKLYEGQSAHIPNGTAHKIVNFGKIPLKYVEIRTGPYVMDDDHLT
jgi:mannose-6-phosphate isomerase-like protein (cupin superfamily)